MSEKKYQVFISSTYKDLINERQEILKVLLLADCIPSGMEAFVATDNEQFEVIKRVIDLCDYYILIIGKRYGSVNKTTGLSYTEMEYDYAIEKGIPVLVFVIDDGVNLPDSKTETDPSKIEKLNAFKKRAMENRLASVWISNTDLVGKVAISIMQAKKEIPRPGWQRATDYDETTLRKEIVELKEQRNAIEEKLKEANKTIESFAIQDDIAFDDYDVEIKYYYYPSRGSKLRNNRTYNIGLPKIFSIIATEMLDVSIAESSIEGIIERFIRNQDGVEQSIYLNDNQLVKRILNQLKVLGLITSSWGKEGNRLYWSLTPNGVKVRDDMILVKKLDKVMIL